MNPIVDVYENGLEMSVEEFNESVLSRKKIKATSAGGNCLFHSLSHLLRQKYPQKAREITSTRIRKDICDYYEKTFRSEKSVSEALQDLSKGSEIEQRLFKLYTFYLEDDTFILNDDDAQHQENICKKGEWGEEADIVVACIIYKVNIVVFSLLPPNKGKKSKYLIFTYKHSHGGRTFYLHLKMDGSSSHYESMDNISTHLPQIPSLSKTAKSKSKSKSKAKESSSEKRTTRKSKYDSVIDKLNRFYAKIERFIPSGDKEDIATDFSDIQFEVVAMISRLDSIHSRSSEISYEASSQDQKKIDSLANLKGMLHLPFVSESDKAKIRSQIQELEA